LQLVSQAIGANEALKRLQLIALRTRELRNVFVRIRDRQVRIILAEHLEAAVACAGERSLSVKRISFRQLRPSLGLGPRIAAWRAVRDRWVRCVKARIGFAREEMALK